MRQDLISLKVDDFAQILATIAELKKVEQWDEIIAIVGPRLGELLGVNGPKELRELTETGLLARLVVNTRMATVWLPFKQVMLIALLKEAGDYSTNKFPPRGGNGWYLKALHLLLDALAHHEMKEYAHLVPTVGELLASLGDAPLPEKTLVSLVREYERKDLPADAREELRMALEQHCKRK